MPIKTNLWKIAKIPLVQQEVTQATERLLEDMIVAEPRILLSDEWIHIGRHIATEFGDFIDLLVTEPDGSLVLIEFKRDHTPLKIVAQALDYTYRLEKLNNENTNGLLRQYFPKGTDLTHYFRQCLTKVAMEINN